LGDGRRALALLDAQRRSNVGAPGRLAMSLSKRILDRVETVETLRAGEAKATHLEKVLLLKKHPAAPDAPGMPMDKGVRNLRKRERKARRA
jgi:hypothetical protein